MGAVVGRERELATIERFVSEAAGGSTALVLQGVPGAGKTTLWEAGIRAARERGMRVLSGRGNETERDLFLAALSDLLDPVGEEILAELPPPQRDALEVALLRVEPRGRAPEARAISTGFVAALRELAARDPVLVAVDDVHWLDSASLDVLAFAARRLGDAAVVFLFTERPGTASAARIVGPHGAARLEVGALSFGAMRRLLHERLGASPPRRVLRRIHATTGGNPLFALELGRALGEQGWPAIGEDLPVVGVVEDLIGVRYSRLSKPVRRLLLAVALEGDLREPHLEALADAGAVGDALDAGLGFGRP
jgi:predicted ATPase